MAEKRVIEDEELDKVTGGSWNINGILCDKYFVKDKQGEDLISIAHKLNCSSTDLVNLNNIKNGLIPFGTELFYPAK